MFNYIAIIGDFADISILYLLEDISRHLFIYSFNHPINLSNYQAICLSIYLSVYLSVCLSVRLSLCLSVFIVILSYVILYYYIILSYPVLSYRIQSCPILSYLILSIYLPIYLPTYLSIYLSIYLSTWNISKHVPIYHTYIFASAGKARKVTKTKTGVCLAETLDTVWHIHIDFVNKKAGKATNMG